MLTLLTQKMRLYISFPQLGLIRHCHITFSGPTSCPTEAHRLTTPSNHVTFSQLLLSVLRLSNIQIAPWDRTPAYAGHRDDSQAFFHVVCSPGFMSAHPARASPLAHEFPPLDPAYQSPELEGFNRITTDLLQSRRNSVSRPLLDLNCNSSLNFQPADLPLSLWIHLIRIPKG